MSKRDQQAEHYVEQGRQSFAQGKQFASQGSNSNAFYQYDNAINQYKNAININPLDEEIYYLRSNALVELNKLEEALEDLDRALKLSPRYEKAHYAKGVIFSKLGKKEMAAECYVEVLEINPDNADVKGMFAYNSGNYLEAIAHFEKMLAQNPQDAEVLCYMGNAQYYLGQVTEAEKSFKAAEKIIPNFAPARYGLGLINYGLKNYDAAYKAFIQQPYFGDAKYYAAKIAYDFQVNKAVVGSCNTVKECNIEGLLQFRLQDYRQAAAAFEKAIRLDATDVESYLNYASLLFKINDLKGTLSYYDKVIALGSNMLGVNIALAYYKKAEVLSIAWKKQEAIEHLDKAIALDPRNEVLYLCKKSAEYSALREIKTSSDCLDKAYHLAKMQGLSLELTKEELLYVNELLLYHVEQDSYHNIMTKNDDASIALGCDVLDVGANYCQSEANPHYDLSNHNKLDA